MRTFLLPDLGEGLREAEILSWHVAVGERVVADQPLVSVETDKAVVEIPSPHSGRIARLHAVAGDVLQVGRPLVDFEENDEDRDSCAIVGDIAGTASRASAPEPRAPQAPRRSEGGAKPATVAPARALPVVPAPAEMAPTGVAFRAQAAPAVRDLARRLEVALESIIGTGPRGAVTCEDVEHAAAHKSYEALHGPRRAMALNMTRAHAEVARTTVVDEADIDAWGTDQNPTVRLVRAVVHAARSEPALNAWYDARTTSRLVHESVDLGIAVDSKNALYVPVVRDAGALDAAALRAAITELRRKAEQHAFQTADLHGATLTLSNFGTIAGRFAALMVMPPQVAIVGAGRIEPRVVASASGPTVHRVLPISLTFDHRCVLGAEAARFLRALVEDLVREA